MSSRELVVLGTASQVPTSARNHNGYMLLWDDRGFLFDPGEGTQRQMTRAGVSAHRITRILITHFHGDHCLGLPGVLQRISLDGVPHPVTVHYPAASQRFYERLRWASIYHDKATIVPSPVEEAGVQHVDAALRIIAHRLDHTAPTFGYRIEEHDTRAFRPDALEALGLRGASVGELKREGRVTIDDRTITVEEVSEPRRGQSMAFLLDTRMCDAAFTLAQGVDLLVCEATYTDSESREARNHGHLTAREAGEIAAQCGVETLVLTHFSRRYRDTATHEAEAAESFGGRIIAATDMLRVPMPARAARPASRTARRDR